MAESKTKPTKIDVGALLRKIADEEKRNDCAKLVDIMQKASKSPPVMWGTSIVGFGSYTYKYESGREGDWPIVGFSPRKQNLTLYIMPGFEDYGELLKKLGKHSTGKSCLYVKRLADIDLGVLKTIVTRSVAAMKKKYSKGV
ncbi:MAG: DUF1801 domain-containing protein [Alphaproteobacteria bacterium]|nr:DUF1801 domain-containing protein [Alphaproteobacteria bacterium]